MTTIGILGAGQLGRMLVLAGYPLGMRFRFLDPASDSPAGLLAEHLAFDYSDTSALERFAGGLDVITYEFENVPEETARYLEKFIPVYPPPLALEKAQDRLIEKSFFCGLGIPTPVFTTDFENSHSIGFPAILKTRRLGYDGKGQVVVGSDTELKIGLKSGNSEELILEEFIPFERELSLIGVRNRAGDMRFYPLVENHHDEGILRLSLVSGDISPTLQKQAEEYAMKVMSALEYVGVLTIEFFEKEGRLLANEMAPRVHNSGHWTIEGAVTSQFENHLRAVTDLPLGSTRALGHSAMINLLGRMPPRAKLLAEPGLHVHDYGKQARPGRKLGHCTLIEPSAAARDRRARRVLARLAPGI